MSEVVLYDFWRSSAAYRVRIALNLAGIDYHAVSVDLSSGDHRNPDHLARNPQGLVPVLEIDGHRFTQSLAILDYLDETRGLNLLPGDAANRAMIRAAAMAIAIDIHPICNLSVAARASRAAPAPQAEQLRWMRDFIAPGLEAFEALLAGFDTAPYCCAAAPTLADICLIPQLYNADRWGIDTTALARVEVARNACASLPAFTAAAPDVVKP